MSLEIQDSIIAQMQASISSLNATVSSLAQTISALQADNASLRNQISNAFSSAESSIGACSIEVLAATTRIGLVEASHGPAILKLRDMVLDLESARAFTEAHSFDKASEARRSFIRRLREFSQIMSDGNG